MHLTSVHTILLPPDLCRYCQKFDKNNMSYKNVQQENNYNESPKSLAENCDTNLPGKK